MERLGVGGGGTRELFSSPSATDISYSFLGFLEDMPARSTPRSSHPSDESLVPFLAEAASLLDTCADTFLEAQKRAPEILLWEVVREVSLTLAALERTLASFANAALTVLSGDGTVADAETREDDRLTAICHALEQYPDRTWKLLPSGGIASLLCQTVDSCEIVIDAFHRLISAADTTGASAVGQFWARRSARATLGVSGAQLAVTLRLLTLATTSVAVPLRITSSSSAVATDAATAPAPCTPIVSAMAAAAAAAVPLRRSRSFVLLTSEFIANAGNLVEERKSVARRLLEITLLPRSAVVWPTMSKEAAASRSCTRQRGGPRCGETARRLSRSPLHCQSWACSSSSTASCRARGRLRSSMPLSPRLPHL